MKSAFEMPHVKSVKAWAVTFNGEMAGRIVANYSDNPNGSVCTATVGFWDGPFKNTSAATGRAGGYGYDKFSAAVSYALKKISVKNDVDGRGDSSVKSLLENLGYSVIEVI